MGVFENCEQTPGQYLGYIILKFRIRVYGYLSAFLDGELKIFQ